MPCIEKDDSRGEYQTVATSEEQSDSANAGACWKVKRQHVDNIAEKGILEFFSKGYVGCFHYGLVHKSVSI